VMLLVINMFSVSWYHYLQTKLVIVIISKQFMHQILQYIVFPSNFNLLLGYKLDSFNKWPSKPVKGVRPWPQRLWYSNLQILCTQFTKYPSKNRSEGLISASRNKNILEHSFSLYGERFCKWWTQDPSKEDNKKDIVHFTIK
jgi:hypothetical protein